MSVNDEPRIRMEIVDREMAAVLAQKSPRERLEIAWGMWRAAKRMLTYLIRAEHTDWTDQEVAAEVARRLAHGG